MQHIQTYESPLGELTFVSDGTALLGVWYEKQEPLEQLLAIRNVQFASFWWNKALVWPLFRRAKARLYASIVPRRYRFSPTGMERLAAHSLWRNHHLRHVGSANGASFGQKQDVGTSHWWGSGAQSYIDHRSVPPRCWCRWNTDGLCRRHLAKGIPVEIRR